MPRVSGSLQPIARGAPSVLMVAALLALGAHLSYSSLRPLVEVFGIIIAAAVFIVAWNGRRVGLDPFFIVIGAAYGSAAVLSLLSLAVFSPVPGLNADAQLAVAARYVRAFSLLVGCAVLGREVRSGLILAAYGAVTAWTASGILGTDVFPACLGEGGEPTPFLLWSTPVASVALVAGAVLLIRRRSGFEPEVLWLLLGSIGLSVLSGFCLSRYCALGPGVGPLPPPGEWSAPRGPWLLLSLAGALDIASYWLIYRCIVVTGLTTPHRLLLRDLRAQEAELQGYREDFEDLVRARTEELRTVSARTEALPAAVPDIVMAVDANKRYTWANPAGLACFGEDCIGKEASYYFEGEQDRYRVVQPLFESPNGDVISVESSQGRRDGEKRLLAWWCRALTDGQAKPDRRAEEALAESQTRYRNLVEASTDWVWEVDANAVYTYASPRVKEILGYEPEEIVGKTPFDMMPPGEAERVRAEFAAIAARGDPFRDLPNKNVRADGEVIEVETSGIPILDASGAVCGYRGMDRDVTDRKRMGQEQEALARLNQAILRTMPHVVLIVDAGLKVVGTSRDTVEGFDVAAALAKGWHPHIAEVLPRALIERVGLEERLRVAIASGVQDDLLGVHHPTSDHLDQWHDDCYMDFQIRTFLRGEGDNAEPQALVSIIDATERHAREQHAFQTSKLAAIGTLAGGVAHDFNNILTGIIGYASVLLEGGLGPRQSREYVEQVLDLAQRAAGLTRQLLLFSRQQPTTPVLLDVNARIEGLAKMLARIIGENVELDLELSPDLAHVRADPTHMEQVVMNLVVNARDALDVGGRITVETANVALSESYARAHPEVKAGPHVMIAVSDTGCGMDEATQKRIFEPFFTTKQVGTGTGLGLATVYGIVQEYGGSISVHSEPGCGTTFRVYLPAVTESAPDKREPEVNPCCGGGETILVLEDETPVLALIRETLSKRHYGVLCASSPAEAEALFEEHQDEVALLLTDVVMPGMLGPELYERLAARKPSLRVIFMSGYTDRAAFGDATIPEGALFLQKPFEPDALVRKVREVLGESIAITVPS